MTTKVFKIGDRVAADWYNPSDYTYTRVKGWYAGTRGPSVVAVSQESDEENPAWLCSKNSMRRLKPKVRKEPRSIWVPTQDLPHNPKNWTVLTRKPDLLEQAQFKYIEFKECIAQKDK